MDNRNKEVHEMSQKLRQLPRRKWCPEGDRNLTTQVFAAFSDPINRASSETLKSIIWDSIADACLNNGQAEIETKDNPVRKMADCANPKELVVLTDFQTKTLPDGRKLVIFEGAVV